MTTRPFPVGEWVFYSPVPGSESTRWTDPGRGLDPPPGHPRGLATVEEDLPGRGDPCLISMGRTGVEFQLQRPGVGERRGESGEG